MISKSFTAVLITGIFLSCSNKGNNTDEAEEEEATDSVEIAEDTLHLFEEVAPPVAADILFDDFFFNFASDSKFQNQRIQFPLKVKDSNANLELTREDWHQYNRFKAQEFYSVIYERENDMDLQNDTSLNEVSVEWIYLKDEYIEKFNFHRINGKWTLTDIDKDDIHRSPNSSFLQFYAKFVSDSTFQRENLADHIKFITPSEDSDEPTTTEDIDKDEWFEMQSDMPVLHDVLVNINYGQTCISQNRKTLLIKGVSNGLYVKFKFDKRNGEWTLIEIEN